MLVQFKSTGGSPYFRELISVKIILCDPGFTKKVMFSSSLPEEFEAAIVTLKSKPDCKGVPKINPDCGSIDNPVGRPVALKSVGPLCLNLV